MNEPRSTFLLVPLLLALAVPAVAQRGSGSPSVKPAPSSPSPASRPSAAPAPRPVAQQPAPRPVAQQPAPRPALPQTPRAQPAPRAQPTPSQPAPRNQPTPRSQPTPRAQPTPSWQPTPGTTPRNQPTPGNSPTPRTRTRGDIRIGEAPTTPSGSNTPNAGSGGSSTGSSVGSPRRNAPTPVGGSVRSSGGGATPRLAPTEVETARPTTRELYDRRSRSNGGASKADPIDNRYRSTAKPSVPDDLVKPNLTKPEPQSRKLQPRTGQPNAGQPNAGQPNARLPRANTPTVSERYVGRQPRSAVPPAVATPRPGARAVPRSVPAAPRLVPRSTTAQGGGVYRRGITSGVVGRYSGGHYSGGHYGGGYYGGGHYGGVYDPWCSYWDPCYSYRYNPYCHGAWGSSLYFGFGHFGFNVSLGYPWWYGCNSYWNNCYSDCWWNSRSSPGCASSSYWWYPSSTYCPTYLYVPSSSVVVVEEHAAELAAAPADPAPEKLVVGGPRRGGVEARSLPPLDLAKKYVELGDFYFKAGRFDEAADAYARARTYAPDDASVHFVLADAAFATADYHFAAFLITEALSLDPTLATADTDKRLFYGDPRQFEAQMEALDSFLAAKPYDAQAHLVRGYNLRFSGQAAAAVLAFHRVLEIAPGNPAATTFLATLAPAPAPAPAETTIPSGR